uniref:Uncharacterized protein n=1 Tax=Mycena chlorophos TaxID=658473 RepID=A0ABQ0L1B9_MYCCL|nr:predicted protein [Mycena chlorophos]
MGRPALHKTPEAKALAVHRTRARYEQSEKCAPEYRPFDPVLILEFRGKRTRQKYALKKHRRKVPRVEVDGGPAISPEILADASFALPVEHPLFQDTRAAPNGDTLYPYNLPPPYAERDKASVQDRPFANLDELEIRLHGYMTRIEEDDEGRMRERLKAKGAKFVSQLWTSESFGLKAYWENMKRAERMAGDDVDEVEKRMFVLHRRWLAREFVRLRTLAMLE